MSDVYNVDSEAPLQDFEEVEGPALVVEKTTVKNLWKPAANSHHDTAVMTIFATFCHY